MIDLHSHTTASDGILSPTELLTLAHETGLKALAITDHDTLGGLEEGASAARNVGIRFIPGVEIEINFPDGQFHLLGLGLERGYRPTPKTPRPTPGQPGRPQPGYHPPPQYP
jgi:predicted metal-dependent phosphoesterase TrpH